ncbi:MAG: hypothetical protein J6K03_07230 [Oscillospiraceae bacterium]|nr:hypothetical protein [Oscillospiraceae bacterium]
MKWMRFRGEGQGYQYRIVSNKFIVQLTGGSIIIRDSQSNEIFKRYNGHHYLYTGDISPDETECFALENGKHFYIYSLENFAMIKKVALPKHYESIDMYGHYADDGKFIYIPAHRWIKNMDLGQGYYEYVVCKYETENYNLVDKKIVDNWRDYRWRLEEVWTEPIKGNTDSDVDSIMKIIFGDDYKQ